MNTKDALANLSPSDRAALAVKLKIHERTIYRWATGKSKIDPLKRATIEAALKTKRDAK